MEPYLGGIVVALGLIVVYSGLGLSGELTRFGLDFFELFSWFGEKPDPRWMIAGAIVGIILITMGITLIIAHKPIPPDD